MFTLNSDLPRFQFTPPPLHGYETRIPLFNQSYRHIAPRLSKQPEQSDLPVWNHRNCKQLTQKVHSPRMCIIHIRDIHLLSTVVGD